MGHEKAYRRDKVVNVSFFIDTKEISDGGIKERKYHWYKQKAK